MLDGGVPARTKLCKGCGYVLDVACFGLKYPERGTRQHLCCVCSRAASRLYYERNPAPYKARAKAGDVLMVKATLGLRASAFIFGASAPVPTISLCPSQWKPMGSTRGVPSVHV